MPNAVASICRAATRKEGEPLHILCMPTHERYESALALTGHRFYAYRTGDSSRGVKDWNKLYAPVPKNYTLLPIGEIPYDVEFDLVMSQNITGQFPIAKRFSKALHIPLVTIDHTLPSPNYSPSHIEQIRREARGDVNVFVHNYSLRSWMCENDPRSVVINQGIDTDFWCPDSRTFAQRENRILAVVNEWQARSWYNGLDIFQEATKGLPVKIVGNSPGISVAAKDQNELLEFYRASRIYIWTARISPAPLSVLEAMACGCAVVSNATCNIPDVIKHGVNGLISDNVQQLRNYCDMLLHKPDVAEKLGQEARKTVVDRFSLPRFVDEWQKVFSRAKEIVYTGEGYEDKSFA
jgi:glycosyltransferase involved in cell wall biosynthesis